MQIILRNFVVVISISEKAEKIKSDTPNVIEG